MTFKVKIDATAFADLARQYKATPAKLAKGIASGINKAGDQGYTAGTKALKKQTGIRTDAVKRSKGLFKQLAKPEKLEFAMVARSAHTPLSYFNPKQRRKGVVANPWNERKLFRGAFLGTMRSGFVGVFKRVGYETPAKGRPKTIARGRDARGRFTGSGAPPKARGKIEQLWGPSLAKELHKGDVPRAFSDAATAALPRTMNHEVQRILQGIKPKRK